MVVRRSSSSASGSACCVSRTPWHAARSTGATGTPATSRGTAGLVVRDGATLSLQPGTEIRFAPNTRLQVAVPTAGSEAGGLVASGTPSAPIRMLADAGVWGGIFIDDDEVTSLTQRFASQMRRRMFGFVFQDFELLEYLNVLDNVLHPYRITGALRLDRTVRARARQLADDLGGGDKLARHPSHLSQGERQRVAICRALLPQPRLLLADEATGNLDPHNKGRILDLLFNSVDARGATLLAVTHDHELLPRFERVVDFADFQSDVRAAAATASERRSAP